jgi:hypothetical protein
MQKKIFVIIGVIISVFIIVVNVGYLFATKETEIKKEEVLKKNQYNEELEDIYIPSFYHKSSYKPEDFYGEWVAVKFAFLLCGNYQDYTLENIEENIKEIKKSILSIEKYFQDKITTSNRLLIQENYLQSSWWDPNKNQYENIIYNNKQFVANYEGVSDMHPSEGYIDGNSYDVLGSIENIKDGMLNNDYLINNDYIIVNNNKLIEKRQNDIMLTIYIRAEEVKKLNSDKITLEIPYNMNINNGACDTDKEYLNELETNKTHIKELDEYAEKLKQEGKFNIIRAYARNSAIDNE